MVSKQVVTYKWGILYWGYNLLTDHLLNSCDIQVESFGGYFMEICRWVSNVKN